MDERRNQMGNTKYTEKNKNENTTYLNFCDIEKAVLRWKFNSNKCLYQK
jgi:hypothetical protein